MFDVIDTHEEELESYTGAVALQALGIYGDRAVEFIREWACVPNQDSRSTAVSFLEFIGVEPAVEIPILL